MTNPNEATYQQIVEQGKYRELYVMIIDGNLIDSGLNKRHLLKEVRDKYPGKLRYIKWVPKRKTLEKLFPQ